MKSLLSLYEKPVEKHRSLSMLLTLGTLMANGARAEAREHRDRLLRRLANGARSSSEPEREPVQCTKVNRPQ